MKQTILILSGAILFFTGCATRPDKEQNAEQEVQQKNSTPATASGNWRYRYDFDGDQLPDSITYAYSGGAHCCYQLTVHCTKTGAGSVIPFFIEGGYIVFDLSQPDNFWIGDKNHDAIYELYLNLDHYKLNRSEEELAALQKKYHFGGTKIKITLDSGALAVTDAKE